MAKPKLGADIFYNGGSIMPAKITAVHSETRVSLVAFGVSSSSHHTSVDFGPADVTGKWFWSLPEPKKATATPAPEPTTPPQAAAETPADS